MCSLEAEVSWTTENAILLPSSPGSLCNTGSQAPSQKGKEKQALLWPNVIHFLHCCCL